VGRGPMRAPAAAVHADEGELAVPVGRGWLGSAAGQYRIVYYGYRRDANDNVFPFTGVSGTFTLVA